LLGSFGPVDPLAHGNGLHVIDRSQDGLYARSASGAPRPADPLHAHLNRLYANASQASGDPAPLRNHTVNRAHHHSQPKGPTR
jgi:hypothetical protein